MLHLHMDWLYSRWLCIMQAIPDILQPLEDAIHQRFIPALFG